MAKILLQDGAAAAAPTVSIGLLDGFQLRRGGAPVSVPLSAQRVIAFLALHDRPLQRLFVAGTLWLEASEEHANASLRTALWRLRRPDCPLVRATPSQLALAPEVAVDVRAAAASARRAIRREFDELDVAELRDAGDLLPDWYDDWLLIERERFRQLRLHALEALCETLVETGRHGEGAEAALAAIAVEPLRESAHRALIRVHLAEGNRGEAIRQYGMFRDLLMSSLGLEPSGQMRELVTSLPIS